MTFRIHSRLGVLAAVAVAGTYFHFLIFTEFALLELAGGEGAMGLMGALAVGGLVGSGLAAGLVRSQGARFSVLAAMLNLAALLALCAPAWAPATWGVAGGFCEGLALGFATVTLARCLHALRAFVPLGRVIGWGTGLAYALANVPAVFESTSAAQAHWGAAGAAAAGAAAVALAWSRPTSVPGARGSAADVLGAPMLGKELAAPALGAAFVALTLLVWMDSAVFYIIQHNPVLRGNSWAGQTGLWGNALMHLVMAVLSGWWLDRGRGPAVLVMAWSLLGAGAVLVQQGSDLAVYSGFTYTAGVSLYSVALVWEAARRESWWHAGALFAVAGWIGSGLGIGMARDLANVPVWFLLVSGVAILGVLYGRRLLRWSGPAAGLVLGLGVVALERKGAAAPVDSVARGRQVYREEGCIQCHSQFLRLDHATDSVLYGPGRDVASQVAGDPPLIGNRRLGPDLSNIANRRSRTWNRLHLEDPRSLVPQSPMPSYRALFAEGDGRGEALLDYLGSLGDETLAARWTTLSAWQPTTTESPADAAAGRRLWAESCAACHGLEGRGDGPLAARLDYAPPDFALGVWRRVPTAGQIAPQEQELMRVIKFGLPGSPMPGHEWFDDAALRQLATLVLQLHSGNTSAKP